MVASKSKGQSPGIGKAVPGTEKKHALMAGLVCSWVVVWCVGCDKRCGHSPATRSALFTCREAKTRKPVLDGVLCNEYGVYKPNEQSMQCTAPM